MELDNRLLTESEVKSLLEKKINVYSDTYVSYRITISVKSTRLNFYQMFLRQFDKDGLFIMDAYDISVKCATQIDKSGDKVYIVINNDRQEVSWSKVDVSYQDLKIEGVSYTKITYHFNNCHPVMIAKIITDITDCVNFVNQIYGYTEEGKEVLLVKYPIGTVVNLINSGNSDFDWIISGYEYSRNESIFLYRIERWKDNEMMGFASVKEDQLKISRQNNLDILLG